MNPWIEVHAAVRELNHTLDEVEWLLLILRIL